MALVAERSVPWREGKWDVDEIRQAVFAGHAAGSGAMKVNVSRGGAQAWRGGERLSSYPIVPGATVEGLTVSPLPGARSERLMSGGKEWNLGGIARNRDLLLTSAGGGTIYQVGSGFAICPSVDGQGAVVAYNDAQTAITNPGLPTSGYRYDCIGIRVQEGTTPSASFELISGQQATTPALPTIPPGLGEKHWGLLYVILRSATEVSGAGWFQVEAQNAWSAPPAGGVVWSAANVVNGTSAFQPPTGYWGDMNLMAGLLLDGVVEVGLIPRRDVWMKFDVWLPFFAQGSPPDAWIIQPMFSTGTPLKQMSVPNFRGTTGSTKTGAYGEQPTLIALLEGGQTYRVRPYGTQSGATIYNHSSFGTNLGPKRPRDQLSILGYPLGRGGPYRYA